MKVRISYAIGLEEVPEKIEEMLNQLDIIKAEQTIDLASQMVRLGNLEMGNTLIEQARVKLAGLDRALSDTQMILGGYINAKNGTPPKPEEASENVD